ncbi:MAG: HAD family phosphatase [Ahrensia sp.]|nr:HAD family phosphatase [Ahrensia sp.]
METRSPTAGALHGIELVIFDFDGVVADSEVLSLGTLRETLADCGLPMPLEEVRAQFLGTSLTTISEYIARAGPRGALDGFAERWQSALYSRLLAELKPMPAVVPFLDYLKVHGVRHCIASSSKLDRIRLSLAAMRLEDRFPDVFSAEQVRNGKPAPDLFLFAAQQIGIRAEACLVIEDSPHGVRGAIAAGMRAFGFVDGAHLRNIQHTHGNLLLNAGAEFVLKDFAELLPTQSCDSPRVLHNN